MKTSAVACALDFTSFLLEIGISPERVMLIESPGHLGERTLVVEIADSEKEKVETSFKAFEAAKGKEWRDNGVSRIALKTGHLNNWPELRRSAEGSGILLFAQYAEAQRSLKQFVLFRLNFRGMSRDKKVSLWRKLYGYSQKVGRKRYEQKGLVEQLSGKKMEKGIVLIPAAASQQFTEFLSSNKVEFAAKKVWGDEL